MTDNNPIPTVTPEISNIINAIMNTAIHPDLTTILSDISLVLNLVHHIKESNGGLHPTAISVLKSLL